MRPAGPGDRAWIEERLFARLDGNMFPVANLAAHGWDGEAPRAMRFWCDPDRGLLLGGTNEGMVLPVAVRADPAAAAAALSGRAIIGVIGSADEARPLIASMGLGCPAVKLDRDEPQFGLALSRLAVPGGPGAIVPLGEIAPDIAVGWRTDYLVETLGEPADLARATAEGDVARQIAAQSHVALVADGRPVAVSGVNAAVPGIVQIGGVWTPPGLRGRGHARRAVALHLAALRSRGVRAATLFASGDAAARAYEAVGFRRSGTFSLVLFRDPVAMT